MIADARTAERSRRPLLARCPDQNGPRSRARRPGPCLRLRDLDSDESRIDRADIAKELGDVLWYVAALADYLDLSLDDIATANLAKLVLRIHQLIVAGPGVRQDDESAPAGRAVRVGRHPDRGVPK
ncbi:MazG nucleotide pyrophosphohydrolase domain-containing protein [Micromonospora sp. NPDC003776]